VSVSLVSGGAAGDAAPDVRARLLEDGRRLAGDHRFVDVGHAFDDVAVAGDRLALADDDDVAGAQREEPTSSNVPSSQRRWAIVSERVLRRVAAWALPRASARASAYVAK
jgi:hypothetical protein